MASLDEIRGLLSSDKIMMRKKGKTLCEQLMLSDPQLQMVQTMELMSATLSWEEREIHACLSKNKQPDREIYQFVKQVVKFCQRCGCIKSVQLSSFVKHQLEILDNTSISNSYKAEHILILTDLVDSKLLHDVPFKQAEGRSSKIGISAIFVYLRGKMTDRAFRLDRKHQNLLKSLCGSLYLELPDSPSTTLKPLVRWLMTLLKEDVADDLASLSVCTMVCDCFLSVLSLFGLSVISLILRECSPLIIEIRRHCFNRGAKDHDLHCMMSFIACLLDVSKQGEEVVDCGIRQTLVDVLPYLESLSEYLLTDDFLSTFANLQHSRLNHRISAKDHFVNLTVETNAVQYFRFFHQLADLTGGSEIRLSGDSSSANKLASSNSLQDGLSSPAKRVRTTPGSNASESSSYFLRLISLLDYRHVAAKDVKGLLTLESLLFHVAFAARWLEGTASSSRVNETDLVAFVVKLMTIWRELMPAVIHLDDKQVLGGYFVALNSLTRLSMRFSQSPSLLDAVHKLQDCLLSHEQRLNKLLLPSCNAGSVTEAILTSILRVCSPEYRSSSSSALVSKAQRTWGVFGRCHEATTILVPVSALVFKHVTGSSELAQLDGEEPQPQAAQSSLSFQVVCSFLELQCRKYCDNTSPTGNVSGTSAFALSTAHLPHLLHMMLQTVAEQLYTNSPGVSTSICDIMQLETSSIRFPNAWFQESGNHWFQDCTGGGPALADWDAFDDVPIREKEKWAALEKPQALKNVRQLLDFIANLSKKAGDATVEESSSIMAQDFSEASKGICSLFVCLLALIAPIAHEWTGLLKRWLSQDQRFVGQCVDICREAMEQYWVTVERLLQYLKSKLSSSVAVEFVGHILHQTVQLTHLVQTAAAEPPLRPESGGLRRTLEKINSSLRAIVSVCNGNAQGSLQGAIAVSSSQKMLVDDFDDAGDFDDDFAMNYRSTSGARSAAGTGNGATSGSSAGRSMLISASGTASDRSAIVRVQAASIALQTMVGQIDTSLLHDFSRLLLVRKSYGSEGTLLLAEVLTAYRCLPAVIELVQKSSWHSEWNSLGYTKVLALFCAVLQSRWFWRMVERCDAHDVPLQEAESFSNALELFFRVVVPAEEDLLALLAEDCPQVRRGQLLCIAAVLEHYSDVAASEWKKAAKTKVCEGLQDSSYSVRLVAAQQSHHLLRLFAKKQKVYAGIVACFPCGLDRDSCVAKQSSDNDGDDLPPSVTFYRDPLEVALVVKCIVRLISDASLFRSHPALFRDGVVDLLRLYATLVPSIAAWDGVQPLLQCCKGSFGINLLCYALQEVSSRLGYDSVRGLLEEHLHWFFSTWVHLSLSLVGLAQTAAGSVDTVLLMRDILQCFPQQLLSRSPRQSAELAAPVRPPTHQHTDQAAALLPPGKRRAADSAGDASVDEEDDALFYTEYRGVVVAALAQLPQQQRWWGLQALCRILRLEQSDHHLHSLVRESLVDLRALHLWTAALAAHLPHYQRLWSNSSAEENDPTAVRLSGSSQIEAAVLSQDDDAQQALLLSRAAELHAFIQRMFVNDHDRLVHLRGQATWLVCQLLTIEVGRQAHPEADAIQRVSTLTPLLQRLLADAASALEDDTKTLRTEGLLSELVDLHFVFLWLHERMLNLRLMSSHVHVLVALMVLVDETHAKVVITQEVISPATAQAKRKGNETSNGDDSCWQVGSLMGLITKMLRYSVQRYPDAITLVGKVLISLAKAFSVAMDQRKRVVTENLRTFVAEAVMVWNYLRLRVDSASSVPPENDEADSSANAGWRDIVVAYFGGRLETMVTKESVDRLESVLLRSIQEVVSAWERNVGARGRSASFAGSVLPLQPLCWPGASAAEYIVDVNEETLLPLLNRSSHAVCDGHQTPAVLLFQLLQLDQLRSEASFNANHGAVDDWLLQLNVTAELAGLPLIQKMTIDMVVGQSTFAPRASAAVTPTAIDGVSHVHAVHWSTTLDSLRPDDLHVTVLEQRIVRQVMRLLAQGGALFSAAQQVANHLQRYQIDVVPFSSSRAEAPIAYPSTRIRASSRFYLPVDAIQRREKLDSLLRGSVHHLDCARELCAQFAGRQYDDWIRMLMTVLSEWFLSFAKSTAASSAQLTRAAAVTSKDAKTSAPTSASTTAKFTAIVASFAGVVIASVDIAETLYPLLVMHLYSHQVQYPEQWKQLQSFMVSELLRPDRVDPRVAKLACYSSFMIIRKYHDRFIRLKRSLPAPSSSGKTTQQAQQQLAILWETFPELPLSTLARVSSWVGLHYTAVYFVEWANDCELLRGSGQASANPIAARAADISTEFLAGLYQQLDNPDAVDGLDITQSLRVQCLLQLKKGLFMEALSTAESILAAPSAGQDAGNTAAFAKQAMVSALRGLGCGLAASMVEGSFASHDAASSSLSPQQLSHAERLGKAAASNLAAWDLSPVPSQLCASQTGAELSFDCLQDGQSLSETRERQLSSLLKLFSASSPSDASVGSVSSSFVQQLHSFQGTLLSQIYHLHREQESRASLMEQVSLYRQLRQITSVMDASGPASGQSPPVASRVELLRSQLLRQFEGHPTAEEARYIAEVTQLLQHTKVVPVTEAVDTIGSIVSMVKQERVAHALSPLLYATWSAYRQQLALPVEGGAADKVIRELSAHLELQESMLLWTKGARQVALSKLRSSVIDKLAALTAEETATAGRGRARPAAEASKAEPPVSSRLNLHARALMTAGNWLKELGAASATHILQAYFGPSTRKAHSLAVQVQAHKATGDFCASVFDQTLSRLQSQEWQDSQRRLQESEAQLAQMTAMKSATTEQGVLAHMRMLRREIDQDKRMRDTVLRTREDMLDQLVHHYSQVLLLSPEADEDVVFRLVGYWLSNASVRRVNEKLSTSLFDRVATYKMVPLQYQIFSRLGMAAVSTLSSANATSGPAASATGAASGDDSFFQETLRVLVTRMCQEHPHHTLPQLFALVHENTVDSTAFRANMSSSRVNAAYRVVHTLRQKLPVVTETMERTLRAYIQLAKASTVDLVNERQKQRLPNKNISYRDVPLVPLPSADPAGAPTAAAELKFFHDLLEQLPAQPMLLTQALPLPRQPHAIARNADDAPLVRIVKIEPTFDLTDTGISRPKIIKLHASDGRVYRQLVKGGDDMRQDAVMQQVFATMNFTLRTHVSTRARDLHIRTYRVMPTSPQTGIIEWVENTEAFGGIINGDTMTGGSGVGSNQGLHQRYFPHDFSHRECRAQLDSAADKEDMFAVICQQFQPSFRFFFTENFHDPQSWYHARLRYIRSVATNSMAGYILGVGDRHAQNILIDKVTGEVVHIDFGIVFEQGKLLTIPELVPFRLTRDVVDGMGGSSGTDGTFRRCCEEVLHVLRQHARNLLTILEVVIHDPLYRWSLSPVQARTRQGGDITDAAAAAAAMAAAGRQRRQQATVASTGDANDGTTRGSSGKDAAEKTLMRIRQKLQGYEDPTGEALKVEAHVDFLINEARSPAHLSRIFVGWAPWL